MIPLPKFDGETAVFGLGRSGLACVEALLAAGNRVVAWDDDEAPRTEAMRLGAEIRDLAVDFGSPRRLIAAPGVPLTRPKPHAVIKAAHAVECAIGGDMDLLAAACATHKLRPRLVGITGTNGKSTTTALIHHMLQSAGLDVQMGGNIGKPVMQLDWPKRDDSVYVLELSSYQLDLNINFAADIGVLTNITPDHIERHGDMAGYVAAKEKLFATTPSPLAVIACDDAESEAIAVRHAARGGQVVQVRAQDAPPSNWPALRGTHNAQNAALARAVGHALGVSDKQINASFADFTGLAHRLQPVMQHGALVFVNDSKATNVEATRHALAAYDNIYWIAGGRPKLNGDDGLTGLKPYYETVRAAYLIGEAAPEFAAALSPHMPCTISKTLARAVHDAAEQADADMCDDVIEGATILLSPACASFDQFADFEMRGDAFVAAVTDWQKKHGSHSGEAVVQ